MKIPIQLIYLSFRQKYKNSLGIFIRKYDIINKYC